MSGSNFEPIPAQGLGAEIFDQPALFFLTHQQVIEQWARLGSTAAAATDQWFSTTVRDSLTALAAQIGMELSAVAGPNYWQHLLLHPPDTPTVADEPVIGLGLCWHIQKVNPKSYRPFVGIRVGSSSQGESARTAFLEAGGQQARNEHRLQGEATWPAYFFLGPVDRWWEDLDSYRSSVLDHVRLGLDRMEAPMRAAIQVLGRAS